MAPSRRVRSEPYSYLHRDTVVAGDVSVEGRLRIDGTVRGSVRAGGVLEIAPGGRVEGGPVHAAEIRIAGSVVGDVHAEGRAEIWKGGLVDGDVHAASLDVEEGARFRGRSLMHGDVDEGDVDGAEPARGGREVRARDGADAAAGEAGAGPRPTPRTNVAARRDGTFGRVAEGGRARVTGGHEGEPVG